MKKTTTTFASLAIAASVSAHTTAVPHSHSGWEVNWLTIFTGVATLAAVAVAIATFRKKPRDTK
ncbi:hypothetical protein [Pelagicoccus sp. SDUM812002]|uniref:hypothetical protein n=1 Tax=Pelagicoccus sp. SDUM812002 TaxID=3041266 RepID=UPI00280D5A1E|nr:hypothetical protein [Pelagicoccus sp. SDUM812002]MDQ8187942.1 hypothetical protein [Pelagicoccus sp. SDUM812002]